MSLEMLKKRLMARGGNAEGRMSKDKLDTLNKALLYSQQAETIVLNGVEQRALLNNNKVKMDYDDKVISIPFSSNIKVGDVFYWGKTGENWIVYLRYYTEDAYFRGLVRKAQHKIEWVNDFGKKCETYLAVRGPVETKIKKEQKSEILFDLPNYTLSTIVPYNEDTKTLKRYSRVTVDNKFWEVTVEDSTSEKGVIDLQLLETQKKVDEDNIIAGDLIKREVKLITPLDSVTFADLYSQINLDCSMLLNGVYNEELTKNIVYEIGTENAEIVGNYLRFTSPGQVLFSVKSELSGLEKSFLIQVEELAELETSFEIMGNPTAISYGSDLYSIVKRENGVQKPITGMYTWEVSDPNKTIASSVPNNTSIGIKWSTGMSGYVVITCKDENNEVLKSLSIKVKPLI